MKRKTIYGIVCVALLVSCAHRSGHRINSFATSENVIHEGYDDNAEEKRHIDKDIQVDFTYTEPYTNVLQRKSYITSYNPETKCPNWVAWHLTAARTDGEIARDKRFYEDLDVPAPRATDADYRGSGWTHGHMCPAGDNKWDIDAMMESNILTNICPQDGQLNSGIWNRLEQDCRKWAKTYGDVYIVCGPILLNCKHETIGINKVVVPEAFYKVILCLKGKPKAIGFLAKNNEGTKKKDQYVNSVDEVERITGIDFFPALPDEIENVVEANANLYEW